MRIGQSNRNRKDFGFTLIELLIVIVILGILSAIVVFSVGGITDRGSSSACNANVATVNIASEAFRAQSGAYAGSLGALQPRFLKTIPGTVTGNSFTVNSGGATYTVTYDPPSGTATSTCPAGSSGGATTTTTTTTTTGPCAFRSFTPSTVLITNTGNNTDLSSPQTATVTFTGGCSAITTVQLLVDKNNDSDFLDSGENHGNMNGGPNTWTIALTDGGWRANQNNIGVRIIVSGGSLGTIDTTTNTG